MKNLLTLLFITLLSVNLFAQETYQKVRIDIKGKDIEKLAGAGIDLTSGMFRKDAYFETDLSESELTKVKTAGFNYKVLIRDVASFYAERAANDHYKIDRKKEKGEEWPIPEHWELGSMGGFYTLDEIVAELDAMHDLYPEIITARAALSDTNLTHEGRKQWWVKISDNPDADEDEPEVLFTGLHHAREPMSYQQMIWFMWYLLENYNTNPDIKLMVDNTEMYFVPVVNPDGFEHNRQTNPNGGGMWRKNRRNNGNGTYGVDPNRNYGYKWGLDDQGSSPFPGDQTYRGPYAFSEPIIANIRDFCNNHEFKIALNYHSYSNLLLYPWGYTEELPDDAGLFHLFAQIMTKENNYVIGPANTTIYAVNGDSNDWMYGEQETKDKIFAYVPEIGGYVDGFWPSTSRIVPLCREQMWQNVTAVKLSGKYAVVKDNNSMVLSDENGYIKFDITRLGLAQCDTFKVSIEPLDAFQMEVGEPVCFVNMQLEETRTDSINYHISANPDEVQEIKYLLKVDNGMFVTVDTITKYYGTEIVLFSDECNTMNDWSSTSWNVTNQSYHTPFASITDSPNGNYSNGIVSEIILDTTLSLAGTPLAFLTFWARWAVEAGWDYVQVMIKAGNSPWVPLQGKYTHPGSNYQDENKPVYDGEQNEWVKEEISLADFLGEDIKIKFRLVSDSYVNEDGFYFDDVKVSVIGSVTGIDKKQTEDVVISEPYPNPAEETINVKYNLNDIKNVSYELVNISGKKLQQGIFLKNNGILKLDIKGYNSGVYFLKITSKKQITVKKIVIK